VRATGRPDEGGPFHNAQETQSVTEPNAPHNTPHPPSTRRDYRRALMKQPGPALRALAWLGLITLLALLPLGAFLGTLLAAAIAPADRWLIHVIVYAPGVLALALLWAVRAPVCQLIADTERRKRLEAHQCIWCRYPRDHEHTSAEAPCPECGRTSALDRNPANTLTRCPAPASTTSTANASETA